jgi:hypothetical protein
MSLSIHRSVGILLLIGAVGCDSASDSAGGGKSVSMTELADKLNPQAKPSVPASAAAAPPATPEVAGRGRPEPDAMSQAPPDAKKASDKGPVHTQGGYAGAIVAANRNIRERLSDVAWKKSVELFAAEKGYKPRDTKEFLERVRSEGTPLPEIPMGFTYLYVPNEGQFGELYQVPIEDTQSQQPSAGK